ncbi:MAG: tRNA dihydrouridine synthase DusB [Myxococcales bacterium]|nr:tRNA dihydrouridine synthase DusB [Myxococcales bacterium]MDH5565951.1 tRNA dihydrouridine synthase DusB [Myxococcales bacterium]
MSEPAIHPIALRLLELENNLVLAPMAGVSNLPFRLIARQAGAALVFSETVSAKGLVMGGAKTRRLLRSSPREAPCAFQLFGSDPAILAEACRRLEGEGAAWIDLNVGCPVKKFIRNGAGSALLCDLPRAARIVRSMREAFSGTLSVKMRSGWDQHSVNAPEFARIAAGEGAELISVHGRTRAQQYRGRADREIIRRVVEAVPDTPVLANGDVVREDDAFEMLRETGAAGVMIGRGAMGNPWIFQRILARAEGGGARQLTAQERLATIEHHVALMETSFPDRSVLAANLKKYLAAYSKGLRGSAAFRQSVLEACDLDVMLRHTRDFFGGMERAA